MAVVYRIKEVDGVEVEDYRKKAAVLPFGGLVEEFVFASHGPCLLGNCCHKKSIKTFIITKGSGTLYLHLLKREGRPAKDTEVFSLRKRAVARIEPHDAYVFVMRPRAEMMCFTESYDPKDIFRFFII